MDDDSSSDTIPYNKVAVGDVTMEHEAKVSKVSEEELYYLMSRGLSEEEATKILSEPAVTAIADIKMGAAQATAWGCDLTYDYVKINADYRS